MKRFCSKSVSDANITLKCGSWEVAGEVNGAEEMLHFKNIMGYHQTNRAGLDSFSTREVPQSGLMNTENCCHL